jgi:hypothetical protein
MRRIAAAIAAALLLTASYATGAAAAPPTSNRPVVTAEVTTQEGSAVTIGYTVNRGTNQIAAVTYSLNGGNAVPAPAPAAVTKRSSAGGFTVTAANGDNTLTVTVTLTNGATATSPAVQFAHTTTSYARAGCVELGTAGFFMLTNGDEVQQFPTGYTFYSDSDCSTNPVFQPFDITMVWAADETSALASCGLVYANPQVLSQREPYLFSCVGFRI